MPKEGDAVQGAVRRGELMDESRCCTNHGAPVQKSGVRERERERKRERGRGRGRDKDKNGHTWRV